MSQERGPLNISLEFTRVGKNEAESMFRFKRRKYQVRHGNGANKPATFDWDGSEFKKAFLELGRSTPSSTSFENFGSILRSFLGPTNWVRDEAEIETALAEGRSIDITIRSNAPEIYHLPWELLSLEDSQRQLHELPNCLVRYEWPQQTRVSRALSSSGRILIAASSAGGHVPLDGHLRAIQEACRNANFPFDPKRDVLPNATRECLAQALGDVAHPVIALHLLCHGSTTPEAAYGLVLDSVNPYDDADVLDPAELRRRLPGYMSSLRMVTICACQSGDAGTPAHPLGSIARMFHRQGVPAVIASRLPLSSAGSEHLTKALYADLLSGSRSLRKALALARRKLMDMGEVNTRDWASLQFYAREGDESALYPFCEPPPPRPPAEAPSHELVLICHEALKRAYTDLQPKDAPDLFANRQIRKLRIGQTLELGQRNWENLESQVKRLTSRSGELWPALEAPETELVYYGFPYVPLASLAGFLAGEHRLVHVFEYDRDDARFTWAHEFDGDLPQLETEVQSSGSGSAVRLRLSVSALVELEHCRAVLPDQDVRLDLHFKLKTPERGIVRQRKQVILYTQELRRRIDQYVIGKSDIMSLHIFAAVPVSIAFRLGQVLAATGAPTCYVYNFGLPEETPRYKWRLCLNSAKKELPSVDIFD